MKTLLILAESIEKQKLNFSCSALFHTKARVSLKYIVNDCLCEHLFASNSPQTPSNLILLTLLVTLRSVTLFYPKFRAINSQIKLKFVLLGNRFSDLFTEVKIWY